jgi:hypothetical protein
MVATTFLRHTLVALAAILILAGPSYAQQYLALESPGMPGSCEMMPSWGFVDIAVVHYTGVAGASGIQLAAPMPSCFGNDASWVGDQWNGTLTIGDSQNGVVVTYGQCVTGTFVVGTISFLVPNLPDQCCTVEAAGHPSSASGKVEALNCSSGLVELPNSTGGVLNAGGTSCTSVEAPHTPAPAHNDTEVARNTMLSWIPGATTNPCAVLAYPYGILSMGTHPDSLVAIGWDMSSPFDPGVLEPSTTYYWQVVYSFVDSGASSPVWAFTTNNASLPVEATTWGRLKALYE